MKRFSLSFIAFVALAVLFAGCAASSGGSRSAPLNGSITDHGWLNVSATHAKPPSEASIFDMSAVQWYEYRFTSGGTSINERTEYYPEQYGAISAIHAIVIEAPEASVTGIEVYLAMNGTVLDYRNKFIALNRSVDITPPQDTWQSSYLSHDQMYRAVLTNAALTAVGNESVRVPGGTFNCVKYTTGNAQGDRSYWLASGVPVPVKISFSDALGLDHTYELIGWGQIC